MKLERRDQKVEFHKRKLKEANERIVQLERSTATLKVLEEKDEKGDFHAKIMLNQVAYIYFLEKELEDLK